MAEQLARDNPGSAQAARDVSVSLERLGDFLAARGQALRDTYAIVIQGGAISPARAALAHRLVAWRAHCEESGVALAEGYEADDSASRLINLSTRAFVGAGDRTLIVGFVVAGAVIAALGIAVVAEGIETSAEREAATELGLAGQAGLGAGLTRKRHRRQRRQRAHTQQPQHRVLGQLQQEGAHQAGRVQLAHGRQHAPQRQHQPVGQREHETPHRVAERNALVLHVQPQQAGAAQQAHERGGAREHPVAARGVGRGEGVNVGSGVHGRARCRKRPWSGRGMARTLWAVRSPKMRGFPS